MLRLLAGRSHRVLTGVCARGPVGQAADLVATEVVFGPLTEAQIAAYVATGEPLDKAGAYGIQGAAQVLVARLSGSWTNVVGLPVVEALALLRAAGLPAGAPPHAP
jgi:septum formation protein